MEILIALSDKNFAEKVKNLILSIEPNIESLSYHKTIKSCENWLDENEIPDLVVIEENFDDQPIENFVNATELLTPLLVLSKNKSYAIEALQYNLLDFIVLPISEKKVERAIEKFRKYFQEQGEVGYLKNLQTLMSNLAEKEKDYKKRFMVKVGNFIKSVPIDKIAYFFAQGGVNYLVEKEGKKFPIDNTLDEVEHLVNPAKFFRANRQFIVNIEAIAEIHPYFKGRVKINLLPKQDSEIVISSEKSRSFKEWLDE